MSHDVRFKNSFTCVISGPNDSGKSSFCIELLHNLELLCTVPICDGDIVVLRREERCPPRNSWPLPTLEKGKFDDGVPENLRNAGSRPCIIILDDLLNEVYSKKVCHLFTKGNHRNISVILLSQILFTRGVL